VRAALESIAYQTKDVFDIMKKESGRNIRSLKVDGGACRNNFLMQFQADILGCAIVRPRVIESTALGAAQLAGVTVGLWKGKKALNKLHRAERIFAPKMPDKKRNELYAGWVRAVQQMQINK
jgi:glycerol kinase